MNSKISSLANMINECNNIVFFGGAGVSTESGVRDYRSKNGLYETVKEYGVPPEKILSRSFFDQSPEIFYDFYRKYFIIDTEPNPAHKALAELEKREKLDSIIETLRKRFGKNVITYATLCQNIKLPPDRETELIMPTGMFG